MIPVRGRIVDFLIDRCSDGYAEFLFKSDYDKDCPRFEALCAGKIPDVVPGVPITTEFAADNMDKILKIDFRELKIEKITKYVKEIEESKDFIIKLGFGKNLIVKEKAIEIPENTINIVKEGIEVYIPQNGLVDLEEEANRKEEEIKKIEFEIQRAEKMLSNPGFVNKAPKEKVDEERAKLEKYRLMLEKF